jgi:hypothetical protein
VELVELAQNYFGDTRSGSLVGPLGGLIIAALAVFTVLLIRNMNARIRRLPDRFPDPPEPLEPLESPESPEPPPEQRSDTARPAD